MRNHRGFTLIELMITMVIMLVVAGGILKLLNTNQRLSQAQAERVDLQSNVRTASIVVPNELREINTVVGGTVAQNDILDKQATSVTYRSMRGVGYVCAGTTTGQLRLRPFSGYRTPTATDSAYVFIENNPDKSSDDAWQNEDITSVVNGNTCGGVAAVTINISPALGAVPAVGTPVRIYEVMKLSLYKVDGKSWLGSQSVSAGDPGPQPVLGPLRDNDGLSFTYLNSAGGAAAAVSDVKSVKLTIRGVTTTLISSGGGNTTRAYVQDSLVSQVSLRNAFRP
jgi:prepilin-type N-terminal cleavage/methylation domain-containing protein